MHEPAYRVSPQNQNEFFLHKFGQSKNNISTHDQKRTAIDSQELRAYTNAEFSEKGRPMLIAATEQTYRAHSMLDARKNQKSFSSVRHANGPELPYKVKNSVSSSLL